MRWELVHSNQLHQLLVSVSRHLYVRKDGRVKYQEKPLEIDLQSLGRSRREHIVYYIVRDALSGTFFFEVATSRTMIPLAEFLYRAWEKGPGKHIWGLPASLSVPKGLATEELFAGLGALGVQTVLPPSGFAAGVRVIRDIEDNLLFLMRDLVDCRPHFLNVRCREKLYSYVLGLNFNFKNNKFEQWLGTLAQQGAREVPDREAFMSHFQELDEPLAGGLWLKKEGLRKARILVWEQETWPPFDEDSYNRADELIGEAYLISDRDACIACAWEALELSPYCAAAYNLLAEESGIPDEKASFYEKGMRAGRLVLGEQFFRENVGKFWLLSEARPYMRALRGSADCFRKAGALDRAIELYRELLRLNPGDNQGNRFDLSACLLENGSDDALRLFMARHGDEMCCFIAYDKALWTFRVAGGANGRSNEALAQAFGLNGHVPAYLLKEKFLPYSMPEYYSFGGEDEAAIYTGNSRKAWEQTPGALEWLQAQCRATG